MINDRKKMVAQAVEAARLLRQAMPDSDDTPLNWNEPLELLLGTILAAQSRDDRVNKVIPVLMAQWPDAAAISTAPVEDVEEIIRSTGFFRSKAKMIRECCAMLVEKHGGKVPSGMAELTALSGVGRKTANVVRSNCFGLPAIVVDTHFKRVSARIGLTDSKDPEQIEQEVGALLPESEWSAFSHRVTWFGRQTCVAAKPACEKCPLNEICPSVRK